MGGIVERSMVVMVDRIGRMHTLHSRIHPSTQNKQAYGGDNSPYVYVDLGGKKSWDVFSEILEKAQIVTTPGAGFGPGGEGFIRLSAFASKENVEEACARLQKVMAK